MARRAWQARAIRGGALAPGLVFVALAVGCSSMPALSPVTPGGQAILSLYTIAFVISALILVLVYVWLFMIILRYRARPGDADPPQVTGHKKLEVGWTIAPALVLVGIFYLMVRTMLTVEASPPDALRVRVIANQWWWAYEYPDLGVRTANELHLPVGRPVRIELESTDVVHSFWVPQLGWKMDNIPGRVNVFPIQVDEAGQYDGACTEYCGTQHAWMRQRVFADPPDQFDAWVAQQRQPAQQPTDQPRQQGLQLYLTNTCANCHALAGTVSSAQVGPDLTHLGSRATIGAGVLTNTPENLARWIRNPQDVKPGVHMPRYPNFTDQELQALVAYLDGNK